MFRQEMTDRGTGAAARPPEFAADVPTDQWMATLAHELRDPLNAIVLALDALHPACANEPNARDAREMASRGAWQMTRIIEDVLDLCRSRRGRLPVRTERVDLSRVITAAIHTAGPVLIAGRQYLTVSLPPEPVILQASASRLEQILTNLLSNAARYTDAGGHVWLTAELNGDVLSLSVRDNGIGISRDLLPQIFDAYRRGPAPQSHHPHGLGLGLALVKSLAELHGGTVEARSDGPGRGAEFIVKVPCRPAGDAGTVC